MPGEIKGHGSSANHGHGHKPGQEPEETTVNRKTTKGANKATKNKPSKVKPQKVMFERPDHLEEEGNAAILQSQHETVYVTFDQKREETTFTDQKREEKENKEFADFKKQDSSRSEPKQYPQSHITPANFNVREFNTNLTEFIRTLDDPRFSQVDQEYPVKEFTSIIGMITKSVNDYRQHTHDSQLQLEHLRERMKTIKESLHFSVSRQAMDLRAEDAHQTQEELDLTAKLTQLNAILAQAHADVTEALRLAAETQSLAIKSNIAADKAREETRRLEEEIEKRENAEKKKKEEDTRRKEEDKKRKKEEEKKFQEERQKKEEEWRKMESLQNEKMSQPYDSWIPVPYVHVNESGETEVTCIARGQPGHFDEHNVSCKVAKEMEGLITYQPNEELISHVIKLSSQDGHNQLKHPIYVAIPHVLSRSTAQSKEAVVKAMVEGEWKDLPTRDVTFDTHKDTKFAQAEVRHLTTLLVMSRFKRDYIILMPNKACKAVSSFDQRITLDIEKDTLVKKEHFLLQVQPVDSGTLQDFRSRQPQGKSLLSSSSIVYTQWEIIQFKKPIQVTLPCPPNPAKAKKLALARKLKEEKMKNPAKPHMPSEEQEQEKERERKRMQEYRETEIGPAKVSKWYMGDYANTDEEENDSVHLVYMQAGRWFRQADAIIKQIKVDVVTFHLTFPVERFMVVRTRTTTDDETVLALVNALNEFLGKRFVEVVVRQKTDNPFEVALQVTPISRLDQVVKHLAQHGFDSGPAPSHVLCLQEGDIIELEFSGNIECTDNVPDQLIYKSNVPTVTYFTVKEENKFRQKEHEYFSGLICLTRKYLQPTQKNKKPMTTGQGHDDQREWKSERICSLQLNIPKYHLTPNAEPLKAPVQITDTTGPVDKDLLMTLADQMGDEWKKVAHYLGVHKARVQAIIRNVTVGERSERDAKYDMLLTWIKGAAKALDKVSALSAALDNSDRNDLAETVRRRGKSSLDTRRMTLVS